VTTGLVVVRAGAMEYHEAWAEQRRLHADVVSGTGPETVLLLEHVPGVYTAGKRTQAFALPMDGSPVVETDRGGEITWHGPGQIVGYPIVRLPGAEESRPVDVVAYVRRMERMLIDICAEVGVSAERVKGRTGAWVRADDRGPDRKVAAIGVRVARSVAMHGFALNCNPELSVYDTIVACGIRDAGVTSLSAELGRDVTVDDMLPVVEHHLPTLLA
jgi:lipoyl(octanoyl) transferase